MVEALSLGSSLCSANKPGVDVQPYAPRPGPCCRQHHSTPASREKKRHHLNNSHLLMEAGRNATFCAVTHTHTDIHVTHTHTEFASARRTRASSVSECTFVNKRSGYGHGRPAIATAYVEKAVLASFHLCKSHQLSEHFFRAVHKRTNCSRVRAPPGVLVVVV
jgi:hypothetical protein